MMRYFDMSGFMRLSGALAVMILVEIARCGFIAKGSGSVELYVRDVFDPELLLGLALFGVIDQQAFEGSTVLEGQVDLLIPHSGLRHVSEALGPVIV